MARFIRRAGLLATLALWGCAAPQAERLETRERNAAADLAAYHARAPLVEAPLTLADALRYADRHNIEVWIAALERRFQHELATQSLLKMLPALMTGVEVSRRSEFDAAASVSLETGEQSLEPSYASEKQVRTWNIETTWSLLDFGISFFRARQQSNRVAIAAERERRVRQNLALEVTRAWWQAVTAREVAAAAERLAGDVAEATAKIREQISNKTISEIDGLQIETKLLEQEDELRRYRRSYQAAKAELAALLGMPPGADFELAEVDLGAAPEALALDVEALEWEALRARPELFEKDMEEAISRDEAHVAFVQMFPNLSAFFRWDNDKNRYLAFNYWNTAGIRVTWDLMTIPQQLQQRAAIELQTELIMQRRTAVAVAILTQLHLSLIDYRDALRQFEDVGSIARKRAELVAAIENAATQGKSHGGELLEQRLKHLKMRARQLTAHAAVRTAEARLFNTVGRNLRAVVEAGDVAGGMDDVTPAADGDEEPLALAGAEDDAAKPQ